MDVQFYYFLSKEMKSLFMSLTDTEITSEIWISF